MFWNDQYVGVGWTVPFKIHLAIIVDPWLTVNMANYSYCFNYKSQACVPIHTHSDYIFYTFEFSADSHPTSSMPRTNVRKTIDYWPIHDLCSLRIFKFLNVISLICVLMWILTRVSKMSVFSLKFESGIHGCSL